MRFGKRERAGLTVCLVIVLAVAVSVIYSRYSMPYCSTWYNKKTKQFECPAAEDSDLWQRLDEQERIEQERIPMAVLPYISDANLYDLFRNLTYFGCVIYDGAAVYCPSSVQEILLEKPEISLAYLLDRYEEEPVLDTESSKRTVTDLEDLLLNSELVSYMTEEQRNRFEEEFGKKAEAKRDCSVYTTHYSYFNSDFSDLH